jgi:hypothetical protein
LDTLRDALASLSPATLSADPNDMGPLHEKVCAAVDEMKASGMTPERVLIAVKTIAREAGVSRSGTRLVDALVVWCIEHYYAR